MVKLSPRLPIRKQWFTTTTEIPTTFFPSEENTSKKSEVTELPDFEATYDDY